MGKRGKSRDNERFSKSSSGFHTNMSIREEAGGKKQSHNPKSLHKLNHLQNLAVWASGKQKVDDFGSLGAFFGRRFAEFGQSLGISPDPSLFPCQRCETILQPGSNCTVRVEKNKAKKRKHRNNKVTAKNNVVYTCQFCSHRNLKRGTSKSYIKEICPTRVIPPYPEAVSSAAPKSVTKKATNANVITLSNENAAPPPAVSSVTDCLIDSPSSPLLATGAKLLDSKRRKRKKAGPKGSVDVASVYSAPGQTEKAGTSKRRKKTWTTLKEMAEDEERERSKRFTNFSIPFVL